MPRRFLANPHPVTAMGHHEEIGVRLRQTAQRGPKVQALSRMSPQRGRESTGGVQRQARCGELPRTYCVTEGGVAPRSAVFTPDRGGLLLAVFTRSRVTRGQLTPGAALR